MSAYQNRQLSTPTVIINDVIIPVMPNTVLTDIPGQGKVTPVSAGGGAVDIVVGFDAASKVAKVTFDLAGTAENEDRVKAWKQMLEDSTASSILITEPSSYKAYVQMYLVNHTEVHHKADGSIKCEWQGRAFN